VLELVKNGNGIHIMHKTSGESIVDLLVHWQVILNNLTAIELDIEQGKYPQYTPNEIEKFKRKSLQPSLESAVAMVNKLKQNNYSRR